MRKTLPPIISILALLGAGFVAWRTAVPAAARPGAAASAEPAAHPSAARAIARSETASGAAAPDASSAPAAGQVADTASPRVRLAQALSSDPATPLPRPAVFGFSDAREDLLAGQRAQMTEIENRFLDAVTDLDPARPDDFRRRWRQAVQAADQDFRLRFGSVAYVQFNHDQGRDLAGP